MEDWYRYVSVRRRLLDQILRHAADKTVVLAGDIHDNWVKDLRTDFRDRANRLVESGRAGVQEA